MQKIYACDIIGVILNLESGTGMPEQKEILHSGHRKRMRERYRKNGLEGFEQHEFVELLLYHALPRVNTNKIAHELVNKFKTFANIIEADEEALKEVPGVSDNAAVYFKILADAVKLYNLDKVLETGEVRSKAYYENYLVQYYKAESSEKVLLLTLNAKMGIISEDIIYEGNANSANVDMHKMMKIALVNNASGVILAHNHPDGMPYPTPDDLETTKRVLNLFNEVRVHFIDHYIVAGNQISSVRDKLVKNYFT